MTYTILAGDCVEQMRTLPDNSVDAIVCDPPYGLEFMGKEWDRLWDKRGGDPDNHEKGKAWAAQNGRKSGNKGYAGLTGSPNYRAGKAAQDWHHAWAVEALRVLKPGGHLLAFSGTRTYHRMACAIEDAGFEIRDQLQWLYGSGFPKSLDVSKAIDKARNDDCRHVCRFLATHMGQFRITDIVHALGFAGNGDHGVSAWFREDHVSPRVPTWDQWLKLKELLNLDDEMDAEVWRLNGRKGKPGDAWHEREVIGRNERPKGWFTAQDGHNITAPATPDAERWQGFGTALKPANEPIVLARKPLSELTVAANVLRWGAGALNIDATRVRFASKADEEFSKSHNKHGDWNSGEVVGYHGWESRGKAGNYDPPGRWPANVLLSHHPDCEPCGVKRVKGGNDPRRKDGSKSGHNFHDFQAKQTHDHRPCDHTGYADADGYETVEAWNCVEGCPVAILDAQSGEQKSGTAVRHRGVGNPGYGGTLGLLPVGTPDLGYGDTGGASRFFYQAKASKKERRGSSHPTIKPVALMRYLVRLVTPPGGVVLDPFAGSGTTGEACVLEGFGCILIEREEEYIADIRARFAAIQPRLEMVGD